MSAIHPDETTLLRLAQGDLTPKRHSSVKRHLRGCASCRGISDSSRRLHERLAAAGDSLALDARDPFAARPAYIPNTREKGDSLRRAAEALRTLAAAMANLRTAVASDPASAAASVDLAEPAARLAVAHLLEGAVGADPSKESATFAAALLDRSTKPDPMADGVVPPAQVRALASLVVGLWELFSGQPTGAETPLLDAWRALASFDAPEHLVAWVEVTESLRRSYSRRPLEGRLLAERGLETFDRYGLEIGRARARHARGVALYYGGSFREAHREFRSVLASKAAGTIDRARAVSGAAFCLAARGRFIEAAKEYSAVRRKLKGDGAAQEQYFLQGEMKACLGTAGRWHKSRRSEPTFGLPESHGAFAAREVAAEIVKLASEQGIAAAKSRIAAAEGDPARGYAYLYAAQLAMPKVSSDPAMYVELAKALATVSQSLPLLERNRLLHPVYREQIAGESKLVESSVMNVLCLPIDARRVASEARASFLLGGGDRFALALTDYFEGSAASFSRAYGAAWKLLHAALDEFSLLSLENWEGRARAALGTLQQNRDHNESSLTFFDGALALLDPEIESAPYTTTTVNRAYTLLKLGRLREAKAAYAKGIALARMLGLAVSMFAIRYGLALIDLESGRPQKALDTFKKIAADARVSGFGARVLSAELRMAECLGRLGMRREMLERIRALRLEFPAFAVEFESPLRELIEQANDSAITGELVAHVVGYIEDRDRGVLRRYRPFRLLKPGR